MNFSVSTLFRGLLCLLFTTVLPASAARVVTPFDSDWRFLKADAPGAEAPAFADATWRKLDLPHDWSIEGPFAKENPTGGAGAFLPSGIGWYRKSFTLLESAAGQRIAVEFDGVMANSTVWLNGKELGQRPNGYVSFRYDLTPYLQFGPEKTNVLAVRADNQMQPASRWYTGAGIYRHVRLVATGPLRLEPWSVFVTTPQTTADSATVRVTGVLENGATTTCDTAVEITLLDPQGREAAHTTIPSRTVAGGQQLPFAEELRLTNPALWDLESPQLYRAVVRLRTSGTVADEETVTFGIREARFEAATGFWLNGTNLKIKGVCVHHDAGGLGAAVPLAAWERRLSALKALGCNAIRTSHNPVAPEFLDLCDRLGFLVMSEYFDCWRVPKNPGDYHRFFNEWSLTDLRDTVRRDRNHPCIVLYCAGNEIHDTSKPELAKRILAGLVNEYHANDPTRPVTQALFRPNVSGDYTNGLADLLDVVGTNYRDKELLAAQTAKPTRKIIGTEQRHDLDTWLNCRNNPGHSGQFLWTGIDYLGEARHWPRNSYSSGLLDRTGAAKPQAFQRQSWWTAKPMVRITRRVAPNDVLPTDPGYGGEERHTQVLFSDWSPRKTAPHTETIEVYSNCESVQLLLNGCAIGMQDKPKDDSPRCWKVPFAPGTLEAVARNGDVEVARHELRTAGAPAKLRLTAECASISPVWDDVAYVRSEVTDAAGVLVPNAAATVTFAVSGPGKIIVVDSADPTSIEPFQTTTRKAYGGTSVVILRATAASGTITITAQATGLEAGTTTIQAIPATSAF